MDIQKSIEHVLKTDPAVFQDVLDGKKTFEIRFNDRGYQVGDLVVLKETKFTGQQMKSGEPLIYTGREIQKRISYVLSGYGLHEGWVIFGIQDIKATKAQAVPEGFVLVPMVPSERMINAVRQCYEGEAYLPYSLYSEFVNQAIIERMEAQEPAND